MFHYENNWRTRKEIKTNTLRILMYYNLVRIMKSLLRSRNYDGASHLLMETYGTNSPILKILTFFVTKLLYYIIVIPVFIYSLPSSGSSIKERMLYSSCKGPFLSAAQNQYGVVITNKVCIFLSTSRKIETYHNHHDGSCLKLVPATWKAILTLNIL